MNFILTFLAAIFLGGIWDFRLEENKSLEQVYDLAFTANVSTEEFQNEYLGYVFENLWNNPDVIGYSICQMNDNRTYSRNSEDQPAKTFMGMSHAGLYNFLRQPKKSVETVRHYFSLK